MTLPILILAAVVSTALSGAIGMGGGTILVAVMASILDPFVVVPVHGVVQVVSNTTRTLRLLRHVVWSVLLMYLPMMFVGVWIGLQFYRGAGMPWFKPVIGLFVITFLLWDRFKPQRLRLPHWVFVPAGFMGGVLIIVIGIAGPYLAVFFLRDDLDREQVVATKAAIQTIGHFLKIPAFLSVGFAYHEHVHVILPLLACAVVGTFLGTSVLKRMGERGFRLVFRVILWILALRLVLDAVL